VLVGDGDERGESGRDGRESAIQLVRFQLSSTVFPQEQYDDDTPRWIAKQTGTRHSAHRRSRVVRTDGRRRRPDHQGHAVSVWTAVGCRSGHLVAATRRSLPETTASGHAGSSSEQGFSCRAAASQRAVMVRRRPTPVEHVVQGAAGLVHACVRYNASSLTPPRPPAVCAVLLRLRPLAASNCRVPSRWCRAVSCRVEITRMSAPFAPPHARTHAMHLFDSSIVHQPRKCRRLYEKERKPGPRVHDACTQTGEWRSVWDGPVSMSL